jgi:hypothetical protein
MLYLNHTSSNHLANSTVFSFGWVNASYVYGLDILNAHQRRALGAVTPWETYNKAVNAQGDRVFGDGQ